MVRVNMDNANNVVAGGDAHNVTLTVVDANGNTIKGFNAEASIDFPVTSGTLSSNFVNIQNGQSVTPITFTPATVATKNAILDVQIPGINTIQ